MRVLIAGGGIGGLTAALALQARGHAVEVFEATAEIRPLGVGINLLPHAVQVLDGLDLADRLLAQGVATRELAYFNRHGQPIWSEPRGRAAGYQVPQISVHRGRLQMTLLAAVRERLGEGALRTDRRLTGFTQDADGVVARLLDGEGRETTAAGDLLIAADGIHSAVRRQFYPEEGAPVYSGRILWRGVTRAAPYMTGASMIMAGHQDQKFVAYPITTPNADGMATINWIAELRRAEMLNRENWNRAGRLEDFLPAFEDWQFDWLGVPALIRGAEAVYEFPMVDRDPVPRWSFGRVTMLGDAAHPMYPIGSNGASQAILDARALVEALDARPDPEAALTAYQDARLAPTAAIVLANRGNGPEQVMQLAEERAPDGFDDIETVIPRAELEGIAARYKQIAGFDRRQVEARA